MLEILPPGKSPLAARHPRAPWIAAAVCGLVFVALLLSTSGIALMTPDSIDYAIVARNLAQGRGYVADLVALHMTWHPEVTHVPEMHGLLRPLVLAPLFAAFGPEATLVRVPGLAYLTGAALLTFLLGRRLYGDLAGGLAGVLVLTSPPLFAIALSGNDDIGFAFFFTASALALVAGLQSGRDRDFLLAGVAGGFALLEKLSGLILPGLWLGALLLPVLRGQWAPGRALRAVAFAIPPFAFALGCYLLRNQLASGQMMFRLGSLDWILKAEGLAAAYALHDPLPTLGQMLRQLGPAEVVRISTQQLVAFIRTLSPVAPAAFQFPTSSPLWIGLLSLPLAWRATPTYAWICTLALLGAVAFICGLYHVEARYFYFLLPLLLVCAGGAALWTLCAIERRNLRRGLATVVGLGVGAFAAQSLWVSIQFSLLLHGASSEHPCDEPREWIRREAPSGARILTLDPWGTAWSTGRPSVMVPNGPVEDVLRVARHYSTELLIWHRSALLPEALRALDRLVEDELPGVRTELVLGNESCALYTLEIADQPPRALESGGR